jgi:3-oxoacyl-[acyl-carrier protein] reductase
MREGSIIVFFSPLAGRSAVGKLSSYAATKSAIDTCIRVEAVAPIEKDMSNFTNTDAGHEFALGLQELNVSAPPSYVAAAKMFLASEDTCRITGDTVQLEGSLKLYFAPEGKSR